MKPVTVAIDAMGGDRGLDVTIPATIQALNRYPELHIILYGQQDAIKKELGNSFDKFSDRLTVEHAEQVVEMNELPSRALRYKKQSSMRLAINSVKDQRADACVSAGNTGALMATAKFVLKTLPGISRPAILAMIPAPTDSGYVRMLDLGANVGVSADSLYQFALMGAALSQAVDKKAFPKVALLNIGEEAIKGDEATKQAAQLLEEDSQLNYVGFVEGDGIYSDKSDVVVCDGFAGNVALKASEGLAKFIRQEIYKSFRQNLLTKVSALTMWPVLRPLRKRLSPSVYNGATLIGLQGTVIKSHGGTSVQGYLSAIEKAKAAAENDVLHKINSYFANRLE